MTIPQSHLKKIIAPVVILVSLLAYLAGYLTVCILLPVPLWVKIAGGIVLAAMAGVLIFVTVERINEIRSGETDDLSDY